MPRSEAQKRADKKYNATHEINYKTIGTRVDKKTAEIIKKEADKRSISPSKFLLESALYCINNNINFENKE